jgi:hypothetical protein
METIVGQKAFPYLFIMSGNRKFKCPWNLAFLLNYTIIIIIRRRRRIGFLMTYRRK